MTLLLLFGMSCAKISDPRPPKVLLPKPAADLAVRQISNYVELTVSAPTQNTDGSPAKLKTVEIFRLAENSSEQLNTEPIPTDEFLQRAVRIQSIPANRFSGYLKNGVFVIRDEFQSAEPVDVYASRFRYGIFFANKRNYAAGLSNQVLISPVPIPLSPTGLTAEVTENSINLKWTPPAENMDGSKPARISGYDIYRSENEKQPVASDPINSDPLQNPEYHDRSFQFDRIYYYSVRVVGSRKDPYAVSLHSEAASVTARDVFPPDAPKSFHAVMENGVVSLLWTASVAPDVAGYRIYRSEEGAKEKLRLNDELVAGLSFRDTVPLPDKRYIYRLSAVDTHGNESVFAEATPEIQ